MLTGEFRSIFLPYCLERRPDGRYAVLNRSYKPVGMTTAEHVCYDDLPVCVALPGLGEELAERLSSKGSGALDRIYLYDDGCVPTRSAKAMDAYLARLRLLAGLRLQVS